MKRPAPLSIGDKVAIIAPSSPLPDENIDRAIDSIRFIGLEPVVFPSCTSIHGYFAGKDDVRAKDLNDAFADRSIKGIFCLRGGYGSTRILNKIDFDLIKANPKIFVGYSDITSLHTAITQRCGFMTFHAPMPNTRYRNFDEYTLNYFKSNLFSDKPLGEVFNPEGEEIKTIVSGVCEGQITGGNLCLIHNTLSSPYEINTKGKILLIEEIAEMPYRLDRVFNALALAGKFEDCAGIILGTFTDCEAPEAGNPLEALSVVSGGSLTLLEIFDEVIAPFNKPTIFNLRIGHVYPQLSLPLGAFARLDATNGRLVLLDNFVEHKGA